jgi:hypothetical protein
LVWVKSHSGFSNFANGDWFCPNFRCGILHLAEARGGWRIARRGLLVGKEARTTNATTFLKELPHAVVSYADELQHDERYWNLFKKKIRQVVRDCAP